VDTITKYELYSNLKYGGHVATRFAVTITMGEFRVLAVAE